MNRTAEIVFEFEIRECNPDGRPWVKYTDQLSVSLPCSYCQRNNRTVGFKKGNPNARCWSGSTKKEEEHPPYPGRIINISTEYKSGLFRVTYKIEYDYTPFEDAKYKKPSDPIPFWSRGYFFFYCPECDAENRLSTQNNLVRPWKAQCSCCHTLFTESREMPLLSWLDPETNKWEQVSPRWDAPLK